MVKLYLTTCGSLTSLVYLGERFIAFLNETLTMYSGTSLIRTLIIRKLWDHLDIISQKQNFQTLIYPIKCMIRLSGKLINPDTYTGDQSVRINKVPLYLLCLPHKNVFVVCLKDLSVSPSPFFVTSVTTPIKQRVCQQSPSPGEWG